jgi:hypothetical protein
VQGADGAQAGRRIGRAQPVRVQRFHDVSLA